MKKTLSVLLTVAIALTTVFGTYAYAGESDGIPDEAFDYIGEKLRAHEETINVSQFGLSGKQLAYIVQHIKLNDPTVFFIDNQYSYYGSPIVNSFLPSYKLTADEISAAVSYVNGKLNEIVSKVPAGLDDAEKALFFNDYIVLNFAYDMTYRSDNVYSMFQTGTGTCEAYTGLYVALLKKCGIKAYGVTSIEKNHAWCEVLLDGKWYYADVTWDDPTPDNDGWVSHKELFLSESAINNHGSDFEPRYPADDTKYDGKLWHRTITPFAFVNGEVYGLDVYENDGVYYPGFNVCKYDLSTDSRTVLHTINETWTAKGGFGYWVGCYSGFGSFKDKLIFNGPKDIRFLDLSTGEVKTLISVNGENNIYKLYTNGNTLYYITADDANMTNAEKFSLYLPTAFNELPVGVLSSIEITSGPSKTEYSAGETFDKTGMIVVAKYSDDTVKTISDYTCSRGQLSVDDTSVTVSYTEGAVTVTAEQAISVSINRSCGDGLTWSFDDKTGTLVIDGADQKIQQAQGASSKAPWSIYSKEIVNVEIKKNVTSIGMYAFDSCSNLKRVTIPAKVTSIGINAFIGCPAADVYGKKGSYAQTYAAGMGFGFYEDRAEGDLNGDGEANDKDVELLFKYLSMWNVEITGNLDINGDGRVNNKDLVRLARYVSGTNAAD